MEKIGAYTDRVTTTGEWQGGDVQSGQRATPMRSDYFNMLQRELVAVVQSAGIALDKDDDHQLLQAIRRIRGGGASNFGTWSWDSSLVGNPGQGYIALNNANPSLATELRISEASAVAEDFTQSLSLLRAGDTITFQDLGAVLSYRFRVINSGADNGSYRNIPILFLSGSGGLPADSDTVSVLMTLAGTPDATEAQQGTARVATKIQVDAGESDDLFVTPKKLRWGVQFLAAGNGYLILPSWLGGFMFQWGGKTLIANTQTPVTFPIPFVTAVFTVQVQTASASAPAGSIGAGGSTLTGCVAFSNINCNAAWFAFGR